MENESMNSNEIKAKFINRQIKHLKQSTNNDCGVACFKMAIGYIHGQSSDDNQLDQLELDNILENLNLKHISLWTIDIAHICAIKNIKHSMLTINLGVLDNYSNEHFYSKNKDFNTEKNRVEEKFKRANELGICVRKESIELDRIKYELCCRKAACIVLVDANLLKGVNLSSMVDNENELDKFEYSTKSWSSFMNPFSKVQSELENMLKSDFNKLVDLNIVKTSQNSYCGHFIVPFGYDDAKKLIFYRNPGTMHNVSYTSYLNFEIARKSFGTDEDILFIYS